jgi:potassium transporter
VVGALGVVFGDIGTSSIYTLQTVFNPADPHPVPISTGNVFGAAADLLIRDDRRHGDLRDAGDATARAASWP